VFLGAGYAKVALNSDVDVEDLNLLERAHAQAGMVAALPAIAMVHVVQSITLEVSLFLFIAFPLTFGWLFWSFALYVVWFKWRNKSST